MQTVGAARPVGGDAERVPGITVIPSMGSGDVSAGVYHDVRPVVAK
jgi:hypothetical protein